MLCQRWGAAAIQTVLWNKEREVVPARGLDGTVCGRA